ncbi:MAG TPA: hypothetical protein VJA47_06470 [archaeon]|nr:hypothetical protein [archaeon]
MAKPKIYFLIALLAAIVFISGCAQTGTETTKNEKTIKTLVEATITARCINGQQPPCRTPKETIIEIVKPTEITGDKFILSVDPWLTGPGGSEAGGPKGPETTVTIGGKQLPFQGGRTIKDRRQFLVCIDRPEESLPATIGGLSGQIVKRAPDLNGGLTGFDIAVGNKISFDTSSGGESLCPKFPDYTGGILENLLTASQSQLDNLVISKSGGDFFLLDKTSGNVLRHDSSNVPSSSFSSKGSNKKTESNIPIGNPNEIDFWDTYNPEGADPTIDIRKIPYDPTGASLPPGFCYPPGKEGYESGSLVPDYICNDKCRREEYVPSNNTEYDLRGFPCDIKINDPVKTKDDVKIKVRIKDPVTEEVKEEDDTLPKEIFVDPKPGPKATDTIPTNTTEATQTVKPTDAIPTGTTQTLPSVAPNQSETSSPEPTDVNPTPKPCTEGNDIICDPWPSCVGKIKVGRKCSWPSICPAPALEKICASDATSSSTTSPSTLPSTSASTTPSPTDANPTPTSTTTASSTPTPPVPPHIEVSTGIDVLYGIYLGGGSLVGATDPCGNSNIITGIKVGLTSDASNSIEQNGVASGNGYCWSMTSDDKSPKGWGGTGGAWGSPPSPFNQQYIMGQQATTSYEFKLYNSQPTLAQYQGSPPAHCGDVGSVVVRLYVKC